jgi:hypothetical protein
LKKKVINIMKINVIIRIMTMMIVIMIMIKKIECIDVIMRLVSITPGHVKLD